LVSKNYLSSKPDNYTISFSPDGTNTWTNGMKKLTVKYTGEDVVAEDVKKQNPDVTKDASDSKPILEATVVKWW